MIKGRKSGISFNGVPMVWVDVDYTEDGDLEVVNLEDYGWESIPSWVFSRTSYSAQGRKACVGNVNTGHSYC